MRLTTQTWLGLCALYLAMLASFAAWRSLPWTALLGLLAVVLLGFASYSIGSRSGRELRSARAEGSQARRSLTSLSLLLDVGVVLLNPRHEIDFANSLACDLLGAGDEAELRRRWSDLRRRFEPALAAAAERDFAVGFELAPEEGVHLSVSCQVYRLNEDDCDAFLLLLRDRAVLDALRGDLILASQLKGLSLLYRAIAHDVRGPLHSMALHLELLKVSIAEGGAVEEEAKGEQAEYLTALQGELTRINRALQAVVNETTAAATEAERFDARELVAEIQRLVRPQARLQGVEVGETLSGEPVQLAAQRDRVKQALLNVAINALEAMPEGGKLDLALEIAGDGRAEISVRDSGPGIPAAIRRRVFEIHFTTKAAGTGIGLYVARSIVESHGGEILAESRPGNGSTFRIRLPLAPTGE